MEANESEPLQNAQTGNLSSAPVSHGKERRASLLIKETEQLLNGLHADASRSNALMAELEELLAAAQLASRPTAPRCPDRTETADAQTIGSAHFACVEPLRDDISDAEDMGVGSGDEDEDEPQLTPKAPPIPRVRNGPVRAVSEKRRSSVVTFDGGSLFGPSPSGGSVSFLVAGGGNGGPQPPNGVVPRAPSFSRLRGAAIPSGKSWTEGHRNNAMRRSVLTDVGSGGGGFPFTVTPIALSSGVGGRRSSTTDVADPLGPQAPSASPLFRRASGLAYCSAPPMSVGQLSLDTMRSMVASTDGEGDSEQLSIEIMQHASGVGVGSTAGGSPAAVGGKAARRRQGSGRFMRIIKGLFHTQQDHPVGPAGGAPASVANSMALPAMTATLVRVSSDSYRRVTVEGAPTGRQQASLESARAQGALSGMSLVPPNPPQQPSNPLSSPGSALVPSGPPQQLRPPSRGALAASPLLLATRAGAAGMGGGQQLLAVPPPSDAPDRASPRAAVALARGPGAAAAAGTLGQAGVLPRRSTSMSSSAMRAASATGGGGGGALLSACASPAVLSPAGSATLSPGGGSGSGYGLPWSPTATVATAQGASMPTLLGGSGGAAGALHQAGSALHAEPLTDGRSGVALHSGLSGRRAQSSLAIGLPLL